MKSITKTIYSLSLALGVVLLFTACGQEKKGTVDTSGAEEVKTEIDNASQDAQDHSGHDQADHPDHEGHSHDADMESMESLDANLNFAEGSWAHGLQESMDSGAEQTFVLDKIPFEGEDLSAEGNQQLDDLAALLKAHPNSRIVIKGHTKEAKNAVGRQGKKTTSKVRALWVQTKLSLRGVGGDQMRARGMADEELVEGIAGDDEGQRRISISLGTKE